MSETKDDKTLSVAGKKTLTLKRSGVEHGTVRQDMGRGRTKAVVVETRKRRISRGSPQGTAISRCISTSPTWSGMATPMACSNRSIQPPTSMGPFPLFRTWLLPPPPESASIRSGRNGREAPSPIASLAGRSAYVAGSPSRWS